MLSLFKDFLFFITIFSFFNDNFMVELFGGAILKTVFVVFAMVNIVDIVKFSLIPPRSKTIRFYNIFFVIFSIVTLISVAFFDYLTLVDAMIVMMSVHVAFIYVSYYEDFDKLLYFIWLSVLISSIVSLFNEPISEYTLRTSGGTADPVEFTSHLFMGIGVSIYLFIKNKNYIFFIGSMLLFLYAMLYAGSKTAIFVTAILVVYALIVKFRKLFMSIFSFKSIVIIAISALILFQTNLGDKFGTAIGVIESRTASSSEFMRTADTRFASWEAGYKMIGDYLLTGVGANQFSQHATKYLRVSLSDEGLLNPHNMFVKIFSEAGIFSFLSFIIFLFFLFKERYFDVIADEYFWISLIPLSSILMGMSLNTAFDKHFWLSLGLLSHVIVVLNVYKNDLKEQ